MLRFRSASSISDDDLASQPPSWVSIQPRQMSVKCVSNYWQFHSLFWRTTRKKLQLPGICLGNCFNFFNMMDIVMTLRHDTLDTDWPVYFITMIADVLAPNRHNVHADSTMTITPHNSYCVHRYVTAIAQTLFERAQEVGNPLIVCYWRVRLLTMIMRHDIRDTSCPITIYIDRQYPGYQDASMKRNRTKQR